MVPLKIMKDNNAATNYRSRNFNDHRQVVQRDTSCDHTKLDWVLSLKKDTRDRDPFLKKSKNPGSQSVPSFHDVRQKPSHTNEHHDGPYQVQYTGGESAAEVGRPKEGKDEQSVEKYYNFHETRSMVQGRKTMRVSGGGAQEINWQLHLR